jgi:hypothetical protein
MMADPILKELMQIKHDIAAENDYDVSKVAAAIRSFNRAHPAPPTPIHRKMIKGHPIGRSVWRDDEVLSELRKVKEKLSEEHYKEKKTFAALSSSKQRKKLNKPGTFKSARNNPTARRINDE